jgi:hypothetical protein
MVNFGEALRKGLRFCIEPKRWLPLFILDVIMFTIVLAVLLGRLNLIMSIMVESQNNPVAALPFLNLIAGFIILGVAWFIVRMWIMGSLIHQSIRPKEFEKGYKISIGRLHRIIVVVILVAIISTLAGMVPLVGFIFSLIVSWVFFFVFQGIILDNLGIIGTMKNSLHIFKKSPFDVFIAWLLIAIISGLIMLAFGFPLLGIFFTFFFGIFLGTGTVDPNNIALFAFYLQSNLPAIIAFSVIALVGMELSQVFAVKAQTEFYLQMKKRFPNLLKLLK